MNKIDQLAKIIWDYMLLHQELKPVEAIFALGSSDTRVAERAAELYLQGWGKYVICAGKSGRSSTNERSEAEIFGEIVVTKGVPREQLILEPNSTNTGENLLFVKRLLGEKSLNLRSFILVQKPYMERRVYATCRKQWPEVSFLVTSPQISFEDYSCDEINKREFIEVMVGDLQRIKEYPKLGFQIEQTIPLEVWRAWEELIKLGYTKYFLTESNQD